MATITGQNHIDSLLGGDEYRWNFGQALGSPAQVSYAFMSRVPAHADGIDAYGFSPMNADQQAASLRALSRWAEVANIGVTAGSEYTAEILFGTNAQANSGAYAYFPSSYPGAAGDLYLNNQSQPNVTELHDGGYGFMTIVHELGHALGLKHPGNYDAESGTSDPPFLPATEDHYAYTVMSYNDAPNGLLPIGPMLYDIAAIQTLYGANMTTRTGDDVYRTAAGVQYAIWDAGGTDTIDASAQTGGVTIDLRPGHFSSIGAASNLAIAYGATIEIAIGGSGDDVLIGGSAASTLVGGAGTDRVLLTGGSAAVAQVESVEGTTGADTLTLGQTGRLTVNAVETIVGSGEGDWVDLGNGTNTLTLSAVETLIGGAGGDWVNLGGAGQRVILAAVETLIGGSGGDWVDLGNRGNTVIMAAVETLIGGTGGDRITTGARGGRFITAAVETIVGGAGADWVDLGARGNTTVMSGIETLIGGAGGDWVTLGDAGNTIILAAIDTLIGGAGADHVTTGARGGRFITAAVETIVGGAGGDWVDLGNRGNSVVMSGIESLIGGAGADWVTLGDAGNTIILAAVDTLIGGAGADHVTTGARGGHFVTVGIETLTGGGGADWVTLGDRGNTIVLSGIETLTGGAGIDEITLAASVSTTMVVAGVEVLSGGGSADSIHLGNQGGTITVTGIETLTGGIGADAIVVGSGGVTVVLGAGADAVTLAPAAGTPGTDRIVVSDPTIGAAAGQTTFTAVANFVSGTDRLVVEGLLRSRVDRGSDGTVAVTARGQSQVDATADELVSLTTAVSGSLHDETFSAFRTALGSLTQNQQGTTANLVVMANDGTDTGLYLVTDDGDGTVQAGEVRLLGVVRGATLATADLSG